MTLKPATFPHGKICPEAFKMMFVASTLTGVLVAAILTRLSMTGVLALMPKKNNN